MLKIYAVSHNIVKIRFGNANLHNGCNRNDLLYLAL